MIGDILHENLKNSEITKLLLLDFDGTLINTGTEESIAKGWKEKTGEDWKYKGFWGREDSLNDEVFDFQPIEPTLTAYKEEIINPKTYVVIATGRLEKLRNLVKKILDKFNVKPHELHLNPGHNTMTFKLSLFASLIKRFPNLTDVHIFEDRESHIEAFKAWGKTTGLNVVITQVVI